MKILIAVSALAALAVFPRAAAADNPRYTAVFADGKRVVGTLSDWGAANQPKLNGAPLFDPTNPIHWLKRETAEQPSEPTAFAEFIGGDCLPGRVVGAGGSTTIEEGVGLPYLVVEPSVPFNWPGPETPQRVRLRVATRWVRRLVWERRTSDQYEPATLYYKDGRQLAFRSIRFNSDGISVLTDNERREVRFTDLAELNMPKQDWWESYFEQLALLTPDCKARLTRLETLDGLKATTSADRFQPMQWGDVNNTDDWRPAVQPAWALDTIWVPNSRILIRRFYSPHEVPLALVEPSDIKLRSALAVGWRPKLNKNAQGGPLRAAGNDWSWGIGTHAYTEMHFPLPECVRSFRTRVGLDSVVGKGGCARALVYANNVEGEPLFRSKHLIGSDEVVDTGELPLGAGGPTPELVLVAHPAHTDRPPGADPFDIRDVVDWLEPELKLDLGALRGAVHSRFGRVMPSLEGWTISGDDKDHITWLNRWDGAHSAERRFYLEFRPAGAALTLSRTMHVDADQNWLLIYASRNPDGRLASSTSMIVHIDGHDAGTYEVWPRWDFVAPVAVPIDAYHDRDVRVEVRFVTRGDNSFVDWHSTVAVDRLPSLAEVFEDAPQPPVRFKPSDANSAIVSTDRYSGTACIKVTGADSKAVLANLNLAIREHPRFGEYRFIQFAWKKRGGNQISLDLDYTQANEDFLPREEQQKRLQELRKYRDRQNQAERKAENLRKLTKPTPRDARRLQDAEQALSSIKLQIVQLEDAVGRQDGGGALHHRYFAGTLGQVEGGVATNRLSDRIPEQWTILEKPRDLYQDLHGGGDITGITLSCPDGEYAEFDHIYLGRTEEDLKRAPLPAQPLKGSR